MPIIIQQIKINMVPNKNHLHKIIKGGDDLKDLAVYYYNCGYNCSQCILKSFEDKFSYTVDPILYKTLNAVNTGFGVGSICSALAGGVMIFGLIFDEITAQKARLRLLASFDSYYNTLNCSALSNKRTVHGSCEKIISYTAASVESIILETDFLKQQQADISY